MLEALIFDVDGTLADTERDGHRVAFNQAFEEAGLDWHWDEAMYGKLLAVTGGKERIRYYVDSFRPDYQKPDNFEVMVPQLHAAKTRFYTELLDKGHIPLRPGVKRLLNEARQQGLRIAIATTTTPANVSALLKNTLGDEAESWFEVIGAGDIVPAKKPGPDIYEFVLKEMSLDPEQCMAFEDSRNGILSSAGANLPTIITVNGYTKDDDFSGAVLVLDQMGEPGSPSTVLKGNLPVNDYLTLEDIKSLHERAARAA